MNANTMAKAKREANRFLDAVAAVDQAQAELDANWPAAGYTIFSGSRETGALRRVSMDLTRALAELRR